MQPLLPNQNLFNYYGSLDDDEQKKYESSSGLSSKRRESEILEEPPRGVLLPPTQLLSEDDFNIRLEKIRCKIVVARAKSLGVASIRAFCRIMIFFNYTMYGHSLGLVPICARLTVCNDPCLKVYKKNSLCQKAIYILNELTCRRLSIRMCEKIFCLFSGCVIEDQFLIPDYVGKLERHPALCNGNSVYERIINYYFRSLCDCCDCLSPTQEELSLQAIFDQESHRCDATQALVTTGLSLHPIALISAYLGVDPKDNFLKIAEPEQMHMI